MQIHLTDDRKNVATAVRGIATHRTRCGSKPSQQVWFHHVPGREESRAKEGRL